VSGGFSDVTYGKVRGWKARTWLYNALGEKAGTSIKGLRELLLPKLISVAGIQSLLIK